MAASKNRRLAAILFADIVGYTILMQTNEKEALSALQKFKTELEIQVPNNQGEIANFYGDGCLVVFNSSVDAVNCAQSLQAAFQSEPKVPVRIGLHAGDVVFKEGNVFGDAVNITSRVESMGIPSSILLSSNVRNQIKNKPEFKLVSLGRFEFKNVQEGMTVYALKGDNLAIPKQDEIKGKLKQATPKAVHKTSIYRLLIVVVLLSLTGLFVYNKYGDKNHPVATTSKKPSIAILTFEDGSPDKSLKYLGYGLKEELLTDLIKLQKLDILSQSQINEAQATSSDPQAIGERMNADFVLSGSVRANESIIRLNVRLLDVAKKTFIWAHNGESPHSDILKLQQEFAKTIVNKLPVQLTKSDLLKIQKSANVDSRAYDLYLKGAYNNRWLPEEAQKSVTYLKEAISIDPNFALPYVLLAYSEWTFANFGTDPPIPHWIKAQQYIDKALTLDSLIPEAWEQKGIIQHNYEWDYEAAEKSFKKALTLNPRRRHDYVWFLGCNGRNEELLQNQNLIADDQEKQVVIAGRYAIGGDLDAARAILEGLTEEELQTNWIANWVYGIFFLAQKQYKQSIPYLQQATILSQSNLEPLKHLGFAYGKTKQTKKALEVLDQLTELKKSRYVAPFHFAVVYFGLGDFDAAFQALNKSYEEHDFHMRWIWNEFAFYESAIQTDSRYRELLDKMNLGHLKPREATILRN